MASPVEALPGGLLDRLVGGLDPAAPTAEAARRCAAGGYAAALRAVPATDDPVTAAWRHFAWHCRWLGLPDGTARPMISLGARLAERPPRPVPEQATSAQVWIVGRLLTELRDTRALFTPDLALGEHRAGLLAGAYAAIEQARSAVADLPDLHPHLDLVAADMAARGGDHEASARYLAAAWQGLSRGEDHRGMGVAALLAGDVAAAPLTSPLHWNCLLTVNPSAPDNGLVDAVEALEFTGSIGELDQARAAYDEAAGRYAALGDPAGLATVGLRRAYLLMLDGQPAAAYDEADMAYQAFVAAGRPGDAATAATHRTLAAIADGRLPVDPAGPEAVVRAAGEVGPGPATGLGLLYGRLGRYWARDRREPERATAAFGAAERIWAELAEPELRAKALVDTGQVAGAVGELAAARLAALAALDADPAPLAEPADPEDPRRCARAILAGRLYSLANQVRDVAAMERAEQTIREAVEPLRARLSEFTGTARLMAEHLLSLADMSGGQVVSLVYRASQARENGDDDRAAALFAQARAARRPGWDGDFDEAVVRAYQGDDASASAAYARFATAALADLDAEPADQYTRARRRMLHVQALTFQLNVGNPALARAHFDALRADAEPWWAGLGEAWQHLHLEGRLAEQEDDLAGASAAYDQALTEVERMRGALRRDVLKASFFAGRDVQEAYRDAARVALRRREAAAAAGDPDAVRRWSATAFRYAERARGRALLDLLTANGGVERFDLPPDLVRRWRAADAEVALARDRLAAAPDQGPDPDAPTAATDEDAGQHHPGPRDQLASLRDQLARDTDALHQIEDELRRIDPQFWAAINPQADVRDLDTVAAALPAGATVIQYLVGRTDLLAWAITRDGMAAAHRLAGPNDVEPLTARVVAGCATGGRYEEWARQLADLLLAPLGDAIDAATALLVVPAGATMRLPFAVLPWRGTTLGATVPLTVLPSAGTLCLPAPPPATGSPLVVGDPAHMAYPPAPGAAPVPQAALPGAGVEAGCVADLLPGATLLLGPDARATTVRERMAQAPVIHLATHGVLDPIAPLGSALLLADGDSLTGAELLGLRLGAELIVLSACRTGTGSVVRGEELLGLGRALLAAGARAVVATLWAVNDVSAALLMTEFHRRRLAGAPNRAALRQACEHVRRLGRDEAIAAYERLRITAAAAGLDRFASSVGAEVRDLRAAEAGETPYAHPYHWAPFVLVAAA
ncbi:CHAT domain-containing protein [Micromonospora sp. AP08]|uniref:CHAT domain-containing protein n=1 Tax=Micromonospora sp. AP08 TaxID=2604467 RepID=UPI0011D6FE15|nr:CHAT domain-containing protein [Micromonospora sp. AP08]TYB39650.1 CHAT domain-containing protein [Micromonospora sp. AP08]